MAEQTISITLNGEKKEVAADQTGVQLFSDDKNIIAVRLLSLIHISEPTRH
mgnify:CR=1 FL=1